MTDKKEKKNSLIRYCRRWFLLYSIFLLGIYSLFHSFEERAMENAFPTIDQLMEYEKELSNDAYNRIPQNRFKNCSYIIFDGEGVMQFASNKDIRDRITAEDLSQIEGQYSDTDPVNGFLQSFKDANEKVSALDYRTVHGDKRTLIFVAPVLTEGAYSQLLKYTRLRWMALIPLVVLSTLLFTILFRMKLKKMIFALNGRIRAYRTIHNPVVMREEIPVEFMDTIETLDQLMERLENSDQDKQRIIADLSHDLKTPLGVIMGCAQAFQEDLIPEEEKKKYMDIILKRSKKAVELIDTLVEYTKLNHPDFLFCPEQVELCDYLQSYCSEHQSEIEMAGFSLSADVPEKEVMLSLDTSLFQNCLNNLLANALQYNPSGTHIYIKLEEKSDKISILFADNGTGISPDIADRIFEPFITGNTARSYGRGTGLGLSIVRKIVEMHQGSIRLITNPQSLYTTQFLMEFTMDTVQKERE